MDQILLGYRLDYMAGIEPDRQGSLSIAGRVAAGGADNGEPGPREADSLPVFTAFLSDPAGNKIEIIHYGLSRTQYLFRIG